MDRWRAFQGSSYYFQEYGLKTQYVEKSEETEALKLMCLAKYGMSIAFAQYQQEVCNEHGFDYSDVIAWDRNYNRYVGNELKRPILKSPGDTIGGHCVIRTLRY